MSARDWMPVADANLIVKNLTEGVYRMRGQASVGSSNINTHWMFMVDAVVGAYTFPLENVQPQKPISPSNVPLKLSGASDGGVFPKYKP